MKATILKKKTEKVERVTPVDRYTEIEYLYVKRNSDTVSYLVPNVSYLPIGSRFRRTYTRVLRRRGHPTAGQGIRAVRDVRQIRITIRGRTERT